MAFTVEESIALQALLAGELRELDGAWMVVRDDQLREVSPRLVRGLIGERLVAPNGSGAYRLTERGRSAAEQAAAALRAGYRAEERTARAVLTRGPLLTLAPAADSDEVDYLLVVPFDASETARLRTRLQSARALADDGAFDFAQYRTEVAAIPFGSEAADRGFLPDGAESPRLIPGALHLDAVHALGARGCPDRGVNVGDGFVQWFAGFGPAHPLTTSARVPATTLLTLADQVGRGV